MKISFKVLVKRLIIIGIFIYFISIFVKQQSTLHKYISQQENLNQEIEEEYEYNATLISTKDNINSPEYIEEIAREKLDMYLPNERVYVDIGK